ncbi:hypothetical protein DH2020_024577 [Rehmannia glutinosa]|uniref:B30.2/SPRY domain-containing protein n=1 Tax=Rehmannia glutinosa TaxID=99300 RepID=A0ABR0W3Y5_REHGL
MDTLQAAYRDDEDDDTSGASPPPPPQTTDGVDGGTTAAGSAAAVVISGTKPELPENNHVNGIKEALETAATEDVSSEEASLYETPQALGTDQTGQLDPRNSPNLPLETDADEEMEEGEEEEGSPPKKQKQLSDLPKPQTSELEITEMPSPADTIAPQPRNGKPPTAKTGKKSKKKNKDVWSTTSRKGKKKTKHASNNNHNSKGAINADASTEDKVLIAPILRFPDKNDDSPDLKICLSKVYKAEKVELSEDRLSASSTKGYRMVRATRGVTEGAWYFEIKVVHLGETGHTRLGWSTDKGDLQAPVGYDGNSFGYRDIDGSKVHKALREKYGDEGYKEGDVLGFYINLPDGGSYAPNPRRLVWHKGQRYVCAPDAKEDPQNLCRITHYSSITKTLRCVVYEQNCLWFAGSEISYFKNGICQGVAFTNLYGGCYYPAASMYTLPNQPACVVKFNFGPDFERFPEDLGERPAPRPMIEVPYQSYDGGVENGVSI